MSVRGSNHRGTRLEQLGEDRLLRAKTLSDLGWARTQSGDLAAAGDYAREGLALAEDVGDPFCLRLALSVLATVQALSGHPSRDLLARGMALEGELVHAEATTARICLGRLQIWSGELDDARSTFAHELGRWEEQGRDTATWEIRSDLAEIEYRAGRWQLAAYLQEVSRLAIAMRDGAPVDDGTVPSPAKAPKCRLPVSAAAPDSRRRASECECPPPPPSPASLGRWW